MHAHLLLAVVDKEKEAPSHLDLGRAHGKVGCTGEEEAAAKEKVEKFASEFLGVTAVHPEDNPQYWPGPIGGDVHTPPTNILRQRYLDIARNPEELMRRWMLIINR